MNSNSLTKDIILQQTNCNEIYIKFLGLVEFPKGNISSPFSKDEKPSFKVYTNGTFKCNSTGRQGDVWQFVADLKQLDCKAQFDQVLEIVANEMNLVLPENLTAITQRNSAIQINGNANKKIENSFSILFISAIPLLKLFTICTTMLLSSDIIFSLKFKT